MSKTGFAGKFRPTRGELLTLNRRLTFLRTGLSVLTTKRDQLTQDLQEAIKNISDHRERLEEKLTEAYRSLIVAYMILGSLEVEMQAESLQGTLEIRLLAKSVMGTTVSRINIVHRPDVKGKIGTVEYSVARRFCDLLDELLMVGEMEDEIVKVADELRKTNSVVNALEKVVIPDLQGGVKYVEDVLEEETLEELTRLKILREAVARRRS